MDGESFFEQMARIIRNEYENPRPLFIPVHPRAKIELDVIEQTFSWNWPIERKMKSRKWQRRRNKSLLNMKKAQRRAIDAAIAKYEQEQSTNFVTMGEQAHQILHEIERELLWGDYAEPVLEDAILLTAEELKILSWLNPAH